jgi:hypothetical protein
MTVMISCGTTLLGLTLSIINVESTSMLKKYLVVMSLILSSVLLPSLSYATCTLTGVIVRVTAYDDAYSGLAGYIYFRTSSLSPYYYSVSTSDDDMVSNAIAYMDSGRNATIQGNVAACPAVPAAGGSASLGSLNYILNP